MSNLQRYEYFGEVSAVKIAAIREDKGGAYFVVPDVDGIDPIEVSDSFMASNKPEVGGYYVLWPNNFPGYMPAEAFANCYRPVGAPRANRGARSGAARETAIQHIGGGFFKSVDEMIRSADTLARYLETGEIPEAEDVAT